MKQTDKEDFCGIVEMCITSEFHDKKSMGKELMSFINNFDRGRE